MIQITSKHSCCGCSACAQVCPRQCIKMEEDDEGFCYPTTRGGGQCINCGLCEKVCHLLNRPDPVVPIDVLAAKNINEQERLNSSSGGVFVELAKVVIERGGVVFGAVFDESFEVKIAAAKTMDGVRKMMGSKYVQAHMQTAYIDAKRYLEQGRQVLFSGTPCQIAGLHTFLQREYDNLFTVDLLCYGAPSPAVWRRYLSERRVSISSFNSSSSSLMKRVPTIEDIQFREKSLGWKNYRFTLRVNAALGGGAGQTLSYSRIYYDDAYMRGFLSNVYLRPSCYDCQSKNGVSHSDLTIGDFWGIDRLMPDFDDDKGVSLVLINSERGRELFKRLPVEVCQSSLAIAKATNGGFNDQLKAHHRRAAFYRRFTKGNESIERIVNSILYVPLHRRAARKLKRAAKALLKAVLPVEAVDFLKGIRNRQQKK